jgi:Ran GTPase-activating protein (RanGAP) involved in mRNA processing and transport
MLISDKDHEDLYGDKAVAEKMQKDQLEKKFYCGLTYLHIGGSPANLAGIGTSFKPKNLKLMNNPTWPNLLKLAATCNINLQMEQTGLTPKDMELFAYMLGENPIGPCKVTTLNLQQCPLTKDGLRTLAPSLTSNKSLVSLDLSSTKMGVSGMMWLSDALKSNNTLKNLNLYRNILDVDGARRLAALLKVNKSIESLDIGHNRIRKTGLKVITDSIVENKDSKLNQLAIRANFINDAGFSYLFEKLVIGRKQLTSLFVKHNFMTDYHRAALANELQNKKVVIYVDAFAAISCTEKSRLDRSVWISPLSATAVDQHII